MIMTNLESALAGIEKMTSKATPGPWKQSFYGDHYTAIETKDGAFEITESTPHTWANGEFIAASRTLVPALVKALRTAVEQRNNWMEASLRVRSDGFEKIEDSKLAAILANGREGR